MKQFSFFLLEFIFLKSSFDRPNAQMHSSDPVWEASQE